MPFFLTATIFLAFSALYELIEWGAAGLPQGKPPGHSWERREMSGTPNGTWLRPFVRGIFLDIDTGGMHDRLLEELWGNKAE